MRSILKGATQQRPLSLSTLREQTHFQLSVKRMLSIMIRVMVIKLLMVQMSLLMFVSISSSLSGWGHYLSTITFHLLMLRHEKIQLLLYKIMLAPTVFLISVFLTTISLRVTLC
ncbi:uncharacterized protein TM35_000141030 [Trypanosoma theileri]|uniref:Uncharacterized protein n=1 Tax=Trypanosoma theileri TaxID=67003 RepID=A0A1X0NW31_9TRYP|nr:uncharacterized protein TM35_000141030 [Trypanosoma theileri]ORC88892.1 hypothetical protein TM35_000141030 [Trypanosoma theileri]